MLSMSVITRDLRVLFPDIGVPITAVPAAKRYDLVDTARGLCLIWMVLAHVLTISESGTQSWLHSLLLPGWSTTNFVMLTGFALALIAGRSKGRSWHKRAFQLIVIAYLSNSLFTFLKAALSAEGLTIQTAASILALQQPWTISSILLPTALLLLYTKWLESLSDRLGPFPFLALVTIAELLACTTARVLPAAVVESPLYSALFEFENPTFAFPLGLLLGLGVWAYALGAAFRSIKIHPFIFVTGGILLALIGLPHFKGPMTYLFRFETTLLLALLAGASPLALAKHFMGLLGRSSLLVFILHRFLIQGEKIFLNFLLPAHRAPVMVFLTLLACAWICQYKEKNRNAGALLKAVGF